MPAQWEFQVFAAALIVLGAWGFKSELTGRTEFVPSVRGFTLGFGVFSDGPALIVYLGTHMLVCFVGRQHGATDSE